MLSALENISSETIVNTVKIVGLFAAVIAASVLTRFLVRYATKRLAKSSSLFLASALQFAVAIAGFYYVALWLGTSPGILLAVVAIFSAGIALAADNTAADMIGGAKLIAFNPFSPGEFVTVEGNHGQIIEIGLFSTKIQSNSKGIISVPNRTLSDTTSVNHSRLQGLEMTLTFPMYDDHDRDAAMTTISAAMGGVALIQASTKVLNEWTSTGEQYTVIFKAIDYTKRREAASQVSLAVGKALIAGQFPLGAVSFVRLV